MQWEKGFAAGTALLVAVTLSPASARSAPNCPDVSNPKTCAHYAFVFGEQKTAWPASTDGTIRIPYRIYPKVLTVPEDQAISAIRAAIATWQAWNPRVRFTYQGISAKPPVPSDGENVIGFVPGVHPTAFPREGNGKLIEFDIVLPADGSWKWEPCSQADKSCKPYTTPYYYDPLHLVATWPIDLQGVATHEIGHALGLGDLGPDYCILTMRGGFENPQGGQDYSHCPSTDERASITLGLGDVLGMKKLYPWTCPKLKPGQSYPSAYRYLCPSIRIFSP